MSSRTTPKWATKPPNRPTSTAATRGPPRSCRPYGRKPRRSFSMRAIARMEAGMRMRGAMMWCGLWFNWPWNYTVTTDGGSRACTCIFPDSSQDIANPPFVQSITVHQSPLSLHDPRPHPHRLHPPQTHRPQNRLRPLILASRLQYFSPL